MNWKKAIIAGIVAGIVMIVIDQIIWSISGGFLMPLYEASAHIWKPMEPLMTWLIMMWITTIIFGVIYGVAYSILYKGIPGKGYKKGIIFGLLIWFIATIPGMTMIYLFIAVPDVIISSWLISGLIDLPIAGATLALVYDKIK